MFYLSNFNKTAFDLQIFAEERTEPATPRKRRKVRQEGRVARSLDLTASVVVIAVLLVLFFFTPYMFEQIKSFTVYIFKEVSSGVTYSPDNYAHLLIVSILRFSAIMWAVLLSAFIVGLAITIKQVGFYITIKPLIPDLSRMNPVTGLKKIVSLRSLVEVLKGIVKASVVLWVLLISLQKDIPEIAGCLKLEFNPAVFLIADKIFWLAIKLAVVLLIIGLIDYAYQRWEFERSIRMSKQEIKEEFKQIEGDPQIKRKIRQKQRELAMRRMMAEVPKADVVITNPTTIAIAIRYDAEIMSAPIVVAKGKGFIAQRIKEIAQEHEVPIIEDRPLAWALYDTTEIGQEIPPELYRAVAEILAFVYRTRGKNIG